MGTVWVYWGELGLPSFAVCLHCLVMMKNSQGAGGTRAQELGLQLQYHRFMGICSSTSSREGWKSQRPEQNRDFQETGVLQSWETHSRCSYLWGLGDFISAPVPDSPGLLWIRHWLTWVVPPPKENTPCCSSPFPARRAAMSLRVADCLYEVLSTDAREGSVSSCLDQVYSELFYRKKWLSSMKASLIYRIYITKPGKPLVTNFSC